MRLKHNLVIPKNRNEISKDAQRRTTQNNA